MNKAYENLRQQIDFSIERYYQSYDMSMFRLYYRGHARTEWDLKPSIMRSTVQGNEADILTQAIDAKQWKYEASLFENIAHIQHYGYPTRFLDYSLDVDIALYFACENPLHYDSDGMLYISAYDERSAQHIDTKLISELAYLRHEISVDDFSHLLLEKYDTTKEFSKYKYISDLGINILSWIDHGFMVTPSDTEFSNLKGWNERLYNQKGAFLYLEINCGRPLLHGVHRG